MQNTFIFDFDDTLYSHPLKRVPESAKRSLQQLTALGHHIIVATGRGAEAAEMICTEIGMEPKLMIMMNGQVILEQGQVVYENHIALPSMTQILVLAQENDYACGGYYPQGTLVDRVNERVNAVWRDFSARLPDIIPDFPEQAPLYQGHLYVSAAEEALFPLGDYVLNRSHRFLLNLIPRDAGKGQAIHWCAERYGFDVLDTYAFGDGINDCSMLAAVGHPVAMGEAPAELQAVAEYVTGTAAEDGIELALLHFGILTP